MGDRNLGKNRQALSNTTVATGRSVSASHCLPRMSRFGGFAGNANSGASFPEYLNPAGSGVKSKIFSNFVNNSGSSVASMLN
jgi:hypothetical protein